MSTGRLQFRHFDEIFDSRELAYKYLSDIVDPTKGEAYRLDETRIGEPIVVRYKDENGNTQVLLNIGSNGNKGEGVLSPFHIIDTAKLEEDIAKVSGETGEIIQLLEEEIERAKAEEQAIKDELDTTQAGAGLNDDGTYTPNDESTYLKEVASLKGADNKLDEELARVEQARKDVTGQYTDAYVPNESITTRPIAYIADATSLNDADVKLDEGLQQLNSEVLKNVVVDGVSGVVDDNIAIVNISGDTIPIGPYPSHTIPENPEGNPHPIHSNYSVLDAVTQLDINFNDFKEKLNDKVDEEIGRATLAEQSISGIVNTFSAATEAFSAATVNEIARLDATATRNKVKSTGNTIVVAEATEGTNIEVNIDNKTILSNNGELKTGLKVAPLAPGELEANVREAFRLVNNEGTPVDNTIIKIYKSSSLVSVELINIGGIDYVRITYIDNDGATQTMDLNIQQLIFEAEFKDGLVVNENGEVRVKIDPTSEVFLTVSPEGVKISGIQNAINSAVSSETERATAAENSISADVTTLSATTEAFSAGTVAKFALMENTWNTPGSIKHTIDDAFVKSVASGTAEESMFSLLRYYNDGAEHKYYASSNTKHMYHKGQILETVLDSMKDETSQLSGVTEMFSAATVNEIARLDASDTSISGDVNTLSSATEAEITRATTTEQGIQAELDTTQTGAGLNSDGTYHKHNTVGDMGNYISLAQSLDEATVMLDSALKTEETRATDAENSISGAVYTLSGVTANAIDDLQNQLDEANSKISALTADLRTLSGVVETMQTQMATTIYNTVKAILKGANREINVISNDTDKELTIGFADDAVFGPISLGD